MRNRKFIQHRASTRSAEKIVIHPSKRSVLAPGTGALAVAIFLQIFLKRLKVDDFGITIDVLGRLINLTFPFGLLILLVLLVRPTVRLLDCIYIVGAHHLYAVTGRLSLRARHVEVPYEDMRGVQFIQNILERILGIGTVIVWTAAADSPAIKMERIGDPQRIARIVARNIDKARMKAAPGPQAGQDQQIFHLHHRKRPGAQFQRFKHSASFR